MSTDPSEGEQGCFDWLASSVAGRSLRVLANPETELSFYDGRAIQVPWTHLADESRARHEVTAQALLLILGSQQWKLLARLMGRPEVARRYAYLEILRGGRLYESSLPRAFVEMLRQEQGAWPSTVSAEDSLRCAARLPARMQAPTFAGTLRPGLVLRHAHGGLASAALTPAEQRGQLAVSDQEMELDDDGPAESSRLLERLKSPRGGDNPMSRVFGQLFGQRRSRGLNGVDSAQGGAEMPVGRVERVWLRGVHALRAHLPPGLLGLLSGGEAARGEHYPEWNCERGRYRLGWVRIEECEPGFDGAGVAPRLSLPEPGGALHRALALLGCEYEMHRRQPDGAEFDIGALIEHAIDLNSGETPRHQDVYRASRRTRRDLGVVVALDISGSTDERNAVGASVFAGHLQAAWQLGRSFSVLGDCLALYGFHSWGREHTHMLRLKGHEEAWSGRVSERFARLRPAGYSRIGSAVRFLERHLRDSMRLPNRLLVLITDGFSYDQDYEGAYAREDTRMALREARANGTACVCLCIGGSMAIEQLEAVFGAANLLAVDNADQWAGRIGAMCRRALLEVHWSGGSRVRPAVFRPR